MAVMNTKFYDPALKSADADRPMVYRAGAVGVVTRVVRPVTAAARSLRETYAVIVDAICGRYDR